MRPPSFRRCATQCNNNLLLLLVLVPRRNRASKIRVPSFRVGEPAWELPGTTQPTHARPAQPASNGRKRQSTRVVPLPLLHNDWSVCARPKNKRLFTHTCCCCSSFLSLHHHTLRLFSPLLAIHIVRKYYAPSCPLFRRTDYVLFLSRSARVHRAPIPTQHALLFPFLMVRLPLARSFTSTVFSVYALLTRFSNPVQCILSYLHLSKLFAPSFSYEYVPYVVLSLSEPLLTFPSLVCLYQALPPPPFHLLVLCFYSAIEPVSISLLLQALPAK